MGPEKLIPDTSFDTRAGEVCGQKKVVVLGSTGSIGCSTLDVIGQFPERFEVLALAAGSNVEKFNTQLRQFQPKYAALASEEKGEALVRDSGAKLAVGQDEVTALACLPQADIVVAGVVGMAGLPGVIAALEAGKTVALANKESLVAGGEFVREALRKGGGKLIPVDSEHSAIFQALGRERDADIRTIILTASGGPFRNTPLAQFPYISPQDAIAHPRWSMGQKISVDSATLMNKALEVIEACWLFGVPESHIRVVVHPQSIIHSMVECIDGAVLAQLSVPDMKGAIAYALSYGQGRLSDVMPSTDFFELGRFDFEEVDSKRFPSIELARSAMRVGGAAPLLLNVVNEEAVFAFLSGKIRFDQIFRICANSLEMELPPFPEILEELYELEDDIRRRTKKELLSLQ
jgi:1-deoxy-D-xylulose-5-phosphate reductoisomerase